MKNNPGWFKKGQSTWIKGKTHSVETRKKLSQLRMGKKPSNYEKSRPMTITWNCPICKEERTYSRNPRWSNPFPKTCGKRECKSAMMSVSLAGKKRKGTINYSIKIKRQASSAVQVLIRRGLMVRLPCKVCKNPETDGHHYKGYAKENWLKVQWLCDKCHHEEHTRLRKTGESLNL